MEPFICPKCKLSYVTYTCPPMPECPIKVRNGWPNESKGEKPCTRPMLKGRPGSRA